MQLTKIQELLNGERRGRKFGVVLDLVVGVFQQRPKQPHVDSLDLDANVKMTDTQGKREGFIPVGVDSKADGSPPAAPADMISLARCTKPDLYEYYFKAYRWLHHGYPTTHRARLPDTVCIAQTSRLKALKHKTNAYFRVVFQNKSLSMDGLRRG